MAKQLKTTNKILFDTIRELKKLSNKTGVKVFKAVAEKLSAPASQRSQINVSKLEKFAKEKETIIVPGKVLGTGILNKKITVVAFSASENAIRKINATGGKYIKIIDYISKKPETKIRILG